MLKNYFVEKVLEKYKKRVKKSGEREDGEKWDGKENGRKMEGDRLMKSLLI